MQFCDFPDPPSPYRPQRLAQRLRSAVTLRLDRFSAQTVNSRPVSSTNWWFTAISAPHTGRPFTFVGAESELDCLGVFRVYSWLISSSLALTKNNMPGLRPYYCEILRSLALKKADIVPCLRPYSCNIFSEFSLEKNDIVPGLRLYCCDIFMNSTLKKQYYVGS